MPVEIPGDAEILRPRTDIAHRRLCRLLHHVAELAGGRELTFSVKQGRFNREKLAADFGPGQTHGGADLVLLLGGEVTVSGHPEQVGQILRGHRRPALLCALLPRDHLPGHLAAGVADLSLEVAHARLTCILLDHPQ